MMPVGIAQIIVYFLVLLAVTKPLGLFMAKVFDGKRTFRTRYFGRWND